MFKNKNKPYLIYFLITFVFTIFIRTYNTGITARFTRDESSDLVSMKNIIDHKRITLVGPIAEGDVAIFSSLTYYISLPFVYLSKFDPMGPVLAASFYGIITVFLIWFLLKKLKINWLPIYLLPTLISPFIECSRWAWNPHFIPFWQIMGLLALFSDLRFKLILTGLLFGLTIHQHWYSVFSCIGLIIFIFYQKKKIKDIFQYLIGLFASIVPFIIFDITRPPGLFISRLLYFSPLSPTSHLTLKNTIIKFIQIPLQFTTYISYYHQTFGLIILLLSLLLISFNIFHKRYSFNLFLLPILFQFFGLSIISTPIANRYLIPCVLFFVLWLSQNLELKISKIIIILIIVINVFSIPKILFQNDWTNNIFALKEITNTIRDDCSKNNHSFNVIVLQSPDGNTKGTRFRDLLKIQNIYPLSTDDYQTPQTLYVISYGSWNSIKDDPAYEMGNFRKNIPDNFWRIKNSKWLLYKINK